MSPKNKGKFGKGKSPVEVEDEFVTTMGRLGAQLRPHAVQITVGVVAVLVVLGAIATYQWWNARQAARATAFYHDALTVSQVPIVPAPEPDAAEGAQEGEAGTEITAIKDEDQDGVADSFPSAADRAKAALVHLDQLRAEYGSTEVAKESTLLHASLLYEAGRYADARDMYQSYLAQGASPVLEVIALEGMAYAEEALAMTIEDPQARQAQLEKVLEMFRDIQRSDEGPGRDRALYHEARILAALGKKQEAMAALEKANELVPDSMLGYDIDERLAQLQSAK